MFDLPILGVNDEELERIRHGVSIETPQNSTVLTSNDRFVVLEYNNYVVAIGMINGKTIKAKKVFL